MKMYVVVLEEQRCRDGVMSGFVSWCRHLVHFLFHEVTSLHPPRNDFSTCSTHFSFWGKQQSLCRAITQAHAHADNAPFYAHVHTHACLWRHSVSAREEPHDLP